MPDVGDDAFRIWHEHNAVLNKFPGVRNFVFALAQEKRQKQGGTEGETNVLTTAHAFASIPEHQLVVFLAIIEDLLQHPGKASTTALREINVKCTRLASLAMICLAMRAAVSPPSRTAGNSTSTIRREAMTSEKSRPVG